MNTEIFTTTSHGELALHWFPAARPSGPAPAIVFFFGGGWQQGDPSQFFRHARHFAALGFVALCPEYRVKSRHGTTPFEAVEDAYSALAWLAANARRLACDPTRIIACGGSAGGHLAACVGMIPAPGRHERESVVPRAMILLNPVLDTTETGCGMDRVTPERKTEASPCHHVRPGLAPTLVMHGDADTVVPYENAERFTRLMRAAGNRCELITFPGRSHGFHSPNRSEEDFRRSLRESEAFLHRIGIRF